MRGKIKIIGSLLLICLFILCFSTVSNAAIEIKPIYTNVNGNKYTKIHDIITVNTAYKYCYDMRGATSTLGVNSLDPHLSLSADWGATAYLGTSTYGSVRDRTGVKVTIGDEMTFYSTTNNITGVMDLGVRTYNNQGINNYVSSIFEGLNASNSNYGVLYTNKDTKYVEEIPLTTSENYLEKTKGMALNEVKGWYSVGKDSDLNSSYPIMMRISILGEGRHNGTAQLNNTYRPVIWN